MKRAFALMNLSLLAAGLMMMTGCTPRDGGGCDEVGEMRVFDTPRQSSPSVGSRTETPSESVPAPKPATTEREVSQQVTAKEPAQTARVQTQKPRRVTQHGGMVGELDMQD